MTGFIEQIVASSWHLFRQSAPFLVFGLLLASILKEFISPKYIAKHLGRASISSVVKAALAGIPLPLCSCSVLPVAASLKKEGADRGAIAAFLVSTPESGVDSILISWALLDPVMTVARPVAAFVSAVAAGITQLLVTKGQEDGDIPKTKEVVGPSCGCGDGCCVEQDGSNEEKDETLWGIGARIFTYGFMDLWMDLAGWFFIGLLIAGVISALLPQGFFAHYVGGGLKAMIMMLVVGIPIYICATASTPIAAAFILKGMSPGAALVFLLVGPATNVTSVSVLLSILGSYGTALYLATIAFLSVLFGLLLDAFYASSGIVPTAVIGKAAEIVPGWFMTTSAIFLSILFVTSLIQRHFLKREKACSCDD